eukprot:SM000066S20394  [mRNA]  locus=s66:75836:79595:+ [translate_table: standard]
MAAGPPPPFGGLLQPPAAAAPPMSLPQAQVAVLPMRSDLSSGVSDGDQELRWYCKGEIGSVAAFRRGQAEAQLGASSCRFDYWKAAGEPEARRVAITSAGVANLGLRPDYILAGSLQPPGACEPPEPLAAAPGLGPPVWAGGHPVPASLVDCMMKELLPGMDLQLMAAAVASMKFRAPDEVAAMTRLRPQSATAGAPEAHLPLLSPPGSEARCSHSGPTAAHLESLSGGFLGASSGSPHMSAASSEEGPPRLLRHPSEDCGAGGTGSERHGPFIPAEMPLPPPPLLQPPLLPQMLASSVANSRSVGTPAAATTVPAASTPPALLSPPTRTLALRPPRPALEALDEPRGWQALSHVTHNGFQGRPDATAAETADESRPDSNGGRQSPGLGRTASGLGKRLLAHDVEAAGDAFVCDNPELRESPPKRRHAASAPSDSGGGAWEWPPSLSPQETASDGDRDVQSGLSPRDLLLQHPDASGRKPGPRRTAGPTTTQCIAARERRERITSYVRTLQKIVPIGTKIDTASVLEETIRYVRQLQHQIKGLLQEQSGPSGRDSNARPPRSPELLEAPAGGAATVSSGPGPAPPTTLTAAMEGGKTLTRSNSSDSSLE